MEIRRAKKKRKEEKAPKKNGRDKKTDSIILVTLLNRDMKEKITYRRARKYEHQYYCPYCKKGLTYMFLKKTDKNSFLRIYFGIALDRWLHCSKCRKYFKLNSWGFKKQELNLEDSRKI